MRGKILSAAVFCLVLLVHPLLHAFAANADPLIYVNNQQISQSAVSTNSTGIVYVAASELAKSLGGTFSTVNDKFAGTISVGGNELTYYLDGSVACFNGKNIPAAAPMKILNNRFMVPAVFTADKLGAAYYSDPFRNALLVFNPADGSLVYSVLPGDTLWKLSQVFSTTIESIRQNNLITGDMLMIGQKLKIRQLAAYSPSIQGYATAGATVFNGPSLSQTAKGYLAAGSAFTIRGKTGDWYKADTKAGSGYLYRTVVGIGQELALSPKTTFFDNEIPVDTSRDTITYNNYTVVRGDSVWSISQNSGIPDYELAATNGISAVTTLYPGQILRIPVHHIALQANAGTSYGEVLDWFKQAQYLFPQGKTGRLVDPVSGKSFMVKRTMGSGHSDTEPLTSADTQVMKQLFGGSWSWERKALILEVDGRRFAVSISGMPHAGVDGVQLYSNVDGRSGDYGYGPNYDAIPGNGMDGHFDLYFLNCRRHMDNNIDPDHQYGVLAAGGLR
jgi:LysM repeat protein